MSDILVSIARLTRMALCSPIFMPALSASSDAGRTPTPTSTKSADVLNSAVTLADASQGGIIWGCARLRSEAVPVAVGLYITGAYWFTASTSFANPAVTIARAFMDTFAGIRPVDAPGFVVAQE